MKNKISTQNEYASSSLAKPSAIAPDSRDEQKKKAIKWINKELSQSEKWYLISADWYRRWANFIDIPLNNDNDTLPMKSNSLKSFIFISPDKINNRSLLTEESKLKPDLTEEIDYYTVCEELWNYLKATYGLTHQNDVIERDVIDDGVDDIPSYKIEVYQVLINYQLANQTVIYTTEMSRQTTIENVVSKLRYKLKLSSNKPSKLYFKSKDSYGQSAYHPVEISNKITLNTSGYSPNEILYLDVQSENENWNVTTSNKSTKDSSPSSNIPTAPPLNLGPSPPPLTLANTQPQPTTLTHNSNTRPAFSNRQPLYDFRPGLCGLSNLGNTCFMNSAIQCISNVPHLTEYFKSNEYKKEINLVNPLGRKGEIAEAYADLINEMWSGSNSYTMPRNFKLHLSRFAPQFTGYQQQDSHELLAFLLDGLHEDLNRIIKKPYVELGSHVGKTDEQFAEESWLDHKKRNDSIIVDLFHGLLKSTLNCLQCKEISIKFDPFCYLSLPLPSKKERLVEVYYVALDPSVPLTKYKVSVNKNGSMSDLCASLEQLLHVSKNRMVVSDVYSNKFFKVYEPSDTVTNIREKDDIYVYELDESYMNPDYLRVKLNLKEKSSYQYSSSNFGVPLFLMVAKSNLTYGSLYEIIRNSLKRFLKDKFPAASEEINSKLNDSLNVKDEDPKEEAHIRNIQDKLNYNEVNSDSQEEKPFSLVLCKNDFNDYDGLQQNTPLSDDTLIDWQIITSQTNTISIIAEFTSNNIKRFYNKKSVDDYVHHSSCSATLVKKRDVIDLSECFNLYTKTEDLSEQDYWYCSKCKKHQPSTKKFDLWSLPPVLVVHLKRFSYSRLYRDKIDTQVDFPLIDLDLSSYLINKNVNKNTKYNLIAVSNHYGSLGGGHYTAYAQNRYDSKWYNFDDSCVSSADENQVCTSAAYLLVYLRQDIYNINFSNETKIAIKGQGEKMDH